MMFCKHELKYIRNRLKDKQLNRNTFLLHGEKEANNYLSHDLTFVVKTTEENKSFAIEPSNVTPDTYGDVVNYEYCYKYNLS